MQCTSHSECHNTAACVFKPPIVVDLVHQQNGCSRDAAREGDVHVHPPFASDGNLLINRRAKNLMKTCLNDCLIVVRKCIAALCEQFVARARTLDALVNRLLIMYMIVSTAARSGDLGIPTHTWIDEDFHPMSWDSPGLQIHEIDLHLKTGSPSLESVVLDIKPTCFKGNR